MSYYISLKTHVDVDQEVMRASALHPTWPTDPIHAAAIVAEEAGEAVRAALRLTYEGGSAEELRTELIQTAATAIRAIENFGKIEVAPDRRS